MDQGGTLRGPKVQLASGNCRASAGAAPPGRLATHSDDAGCLPTPRKPYRGWTTSVRTTWKHWLKPVFGGIWGGIIRIQDFLGGAGFHPQYGHQPQHGSKHSNISCDRVGQTADPQNGWHPFLVLRREGTNLRGFLRLVFGGHREIAGLPFAFSPPGKNGSISPVVINSFQTNLPHSFSAHGSG